MGNAGWVEIYLLNSIRPIKIKAPEIGGFYFRLRATSYEKNTLKFRCISPSQSFKGNDLYGMQDFKKLKVWQMGVEIAASTVDFLEELPHSQRYGLKDQMNRAAISIASNIAEGSSRSSDKDYNRYLEIALGSSYELETQLYIAEKLSLGDSEKRKKLRFLIDQEQKMIIKFKNSLFNRLPF